MIEIKEQLNKLRNILCSWFRRLNIVNMSFLRTWTIGLTLIKIPARLFCAYWQSDFKVYMERQEIHNNQHNTEEE